MALNAGLRAWHAQRRKARRAANAAIDAKLDHAGIPQERLVETRNAYRDYLLDRERSSWAPIGARSGPVAPPGVTEGPAVDWSGYDAIASYT